MKNLLMKYLIVLDEYSSEPDNKDPTESESSSEESQPGQNARVRRSNRPVKEISRFNPSMFVLSYIKSVEIRPHKTYSYFIGSYKPQSNTKRHIRRPNYLSSSTSSDSGILTKIN